MGGPPRKRFMHFKALWCANFVNELRVVILRIYRDSLMMRLLL